jgi:hypothetical protein
MQILRDGLNQTLPDDLPPAFVFPGGAACSYPATHNPFHDYSTGAPYFRTVRRLRNFIVCQIKDRSTIPP